MTDRLPEAIRSRLSALVSAARVGQFASVGAVGAGVDNLSLYLLVELVALEPILAKVVAWEVAIAVIFAVNERWTFATFGSSNPRALGRRFLRSNAVRFAGFLVTLGVLAFLHYGFGVWYLAANVVGIGVGFFVNYTAESLYTWRVHRGER
ncbi:GtrA family protein [Salinilacihabitans rarus]|uniref:GtrA family protein n=1 Tax=Salinilacihabitans rarus TaxID=2961596 RepID=UPI0020C89E84|nr:GtrA family protein [Salinilacihabitans rarus]